ncbi:MAG: branched-chain amino acid transaminase [Chloroflexota bacterium]
MAEGMHMKGVKYVFMAPDFVPPEDAKVSVMSHAFNYGTSVFEGIRGYWNDDDEELYMFRLIEHLQRLERSSRIIRIKLLDDVPTLLGYCLDLVRRNEFHEDIYLRPVAYKGVPNGLGVTLTNAPDHFLIYSFPLGEYLPRERPLRACVSPWQRISDNAAPARGKIGGVYINSALAKTDAVAQGFDECIMLTSDGHVSEGSTENIFLVNDRELVTPSVTDDILVGITRNTVIELARTELELKVTERVVDRSELYIADEIFFCGTGAEISGVGEIDGRPIGDGGVGPLTSQIQELYRKVTRGVLEKYKQWCVPVYNKD